MENKIKYLNMMRFKTSLAFLVLLSFANGLKAQTDTSETITPQPRVFQASEMVITATRTKLLPEEVPQPVDVITRAEINRRYQYNVGQMLDLVPGVRIIRSGGTIGADYGLSIRSLNGGPSSNKTLVLIDGRPVNNGWSGGLNFNMLPSEMVQRVEIVKGAGSALYGSRATAGVVNVITRNPQPGWQFWTSVAREFNASEVISSDTKQGFGRPDVSATNLQLTASYGGKRAGHFLALGYRASDQSFYEKDQENDWQNLDGNYKLNYDISDNLKSQFNINWHSNSWKNEANRVPTDEDYRFISGDGALTYSLGFGELFGRAYLNSARYDESVLASNVTTGYDAKQYGILVDLSMPLFNKEALLKIGLDATLDDAEARDEQTVVDLTFQGVETVEGKAVDFFTGSYGENTQNNSMSNIAFFTQYEHKFFNRMNLVLGGRLDRHSEFGTVFNPKLGATFEAVRWQQHTTTLKANYSKGFRAPTIQGLFSKSLGGYGNPDLKPEKTENFDLGLFQRLGNWGVFELSYFRMNVTNLLINDKLGSTGEGYRVEVQNSSSGLDTLSFNLRKNLGSYSPKGVEASLKLNPHPQITLSGAYTYLDPEDFTFQTSNHRYNLSAYGFMPMGDWRMETEVIYNYTGDGFFFDFENRPYESFSTINLMLAASYQEAYRLSLIAQNLGDTRYQLWHYEYQPGRTITLRLETRF
jgi:outer membrane cobalamin receptor